MDATLIAPCGMNCALCMAYQRDKKHCDGCRSDNIPFEYCVKCVIKNCDYIKENGWDDCSRCDKHCARIKQLDKRYRTKYGMSMLENLAFIRDNGMDAFIAQQKQRWTCPECGELICVHRGKCLKCSP
jgi:hypothetical protein